ncbi:phage baseplate assembly protein V [Desulfovibrio sp. JC010]|uniref:phage baseplate assembly protein V n=1 Tax=Desulfovibrio sp. JC010 TaxID=2593641 RepID=UPI0013CF684B|nr:phage baseplate assembly protein V [Desulfovibrio sp. JC010]NDV27718.1 phage baseplate assembly protein V [Desulfovibrio sp. JC010]
MMHRNLDKTVADLIRRFENVLRIGKICEADYEKACVRVKSGDVVTDWLPWITQRAGKDISWWPPTIGEQVMILSPGGDLAQGVVLPAIFQTAAPACGNRSTLHRHTYQDGAVIEYDEEAHFLHAYVPGSSLLECDNDIKAVAGDNIIAVAGDDIKATALEGNIDVTANKGNVDMTATEGQITGRAKGEIAFESETGVRMSGPYLDLDGVIRNGLGQHGGGGEIRGQIDHRDGDLIQHNCDTISMGVSNAHHTHPENGDVTSEPNGGNDGN